jgi:hypothetical protein
MRLSVEEWTAGMDAKQLRACIARFEDEIEELRGKPMNDEDKKWITELEKAARVRTPVGATYAVALALMHVAAQLERIAIVQEDEEPAAYDVRTTAAKK